jgi:hypothetical protein
MYASVFLQCSNAMTHTLIMGVDAGKSWLKARRAGHFFKMRLLSPVWFRLNLAIQPKPILI